MGLTHHEEDALRATLIIEIARALKNDRVRHTFSDQTRDIEATALVRASGDEVRVIGNYDGMIHLLSLLERIR